MEKKIRYKVCADTKDGYHSAFARVDDKLNYEIGKVTRTKPIPANKGYYIAVFDTHFNALTFIELSCIENWNMTILQVEVSGKHRVKKLPHRYFTTNPYITSFFGRSKSCNKTPYWPPGTELWEKVKPIKILETTDLKT